MLIILLSFQFADLRFDAVFLGCWLLGCWLLHLYFSVAHFDAEFLGCWLLGCWLLHLYISTSLLHILLHIRISMWPESSNVYQYWVLTGELRNDVEWPETSATYHWYQISGRMESGSEWPLNQRNFWEWFNANKKDCIICTEERVPVRVCYTVRKRQNIAEWMPVCVRCKKTL